MKFQIIVFALIVVTATAAVVPLVGEAAALIVKSFDDHEVDGSYKYGFETDGGYSRDETGTLINVGSENEAVAVSGSWKYTDPEGQVVEVHYTADEHGFVPVGSHIAESISKAAKAVGDLPPEH